MHEVEKRRAKVARYVARGVSYAEIGEILGISKPQVYRDFRAWTATRRERLASAHDAAFLETLNGMDEAIRRTWEEMSEKDTDASVRQRLLETVGKLLERKARLLGLVSTGEGNTTNVLALVHPDAAEKLEAIVSPERAAQIESEVFEGEFKELPMKDDAND